MLIYAVLKKVICHTACYCDGQRGSGETFGAELLILNPAALSQ